MKTCNPKTCPRSLRNTSRVLRRNVPDIGGSCGDCPLFLRSGRDWWNQYEPMAAKEKVSIQKEDL
jgi:hypothetical protein